MTPKNEHKEGGFGRRSFLKGLGTLTAGVCTAGLPVAAGPFLPEDPAHHGVPTNKKLNSEWTHSLTNRGEPTKYLKSRNELRFIGMPTGGIMAGTLYLGGDGRLWLWDIFNANQKGIDPKTLLWGPEQRKIDPVSGAGYLEPPPSYSKQVIEQGFAIKVNCAGKEYIRELRESDWEEVSFTGQYPISRIEYTDQGLPFSVSMEVFSPFIPLNEEDSGLPATIFSIRVHNHSKREMSASLAGWLQNACLMRGDHKIAFKRQNTRVKETDSVAVFSQTTNQVSTDGKKLEAMPDEGTMCFSVLGNEGIAYSDFDTMSLKKFDFSESGERAIKNNDKLLTGGIIRKMSISPGKEAEAHFVVAWHFPHTKLPVTDAEGGNYYAKHFKNALAVNQYIATHFERLNHDTRLWRDTWYDSSLPHWFLDRTFINTSILATTTCHRFTSGRFWSWEGIGCCPGNCTHVWQYAQAVARVFPAIERDTRERVDLGLALDPVTGKIGYRGEETHEAIDGQAGTVLRILREHQMTGDMAFLTRNWPNIKKAIGFILDHDSNNDGIIDGAQPNTLDAAWYGEISWISSLCICAWKAGAEMAREMGDEAFEKRCQERYLIGRKNIEERLFNGEYFIQVPGEEGKKHLGSYSTCEIDQVFGQSYAYQVGLGRILNREKVLSALQALWKYNFMPDVGPYIAHNKGGRPYALAGDGGMLMDTNPHNDTDPYGLNITWQARYFNECMSGFEHQVASHLMAEGMVVESLVLTRSIHDRYNASKRNPYNEIECSDHYSRAMASYGTFITACGFNYHGPKGLIEFAPKINPEKFKAPFTSAAGWGTYSQQRSGGKFSARMQLAYGKLKVKRLGFDLDEGHSAREVAVLLNDKRIPANFHQTGTHCEITLADEVVVPQGKALSISI